MRRRQFHATALHAALGGAALLAGRRATAATPPAARTPMATAPSPLDAPVARLQADLASGQLSATALVRASLDRIQRLDRAGPRLNAVIELNPDALDIAAALDRERAQGRTLGPLHGIPVLLKDNIATADRMGTTAGTWVLQGHPAVRDAHLVQRLRQAGAVLLGKTNLSEWANIRSTRSSSGWSSRGGFTRNPHVLDRSPSGSSSGSASAAAAGLAPLTIGTETDGSIVSPASSCGVVGFKPTVGLVSRDGIVPISHTQDTAGPMARSVADCAALLAVMAGADPRDAATAAIPPNAQAEALVAALSRLDPQALRGARIGIARSHFNRHPGVQALAETALAVLRAQGAELVDPVVVAPEGAYGEAELAVLLHEFKHGLARYLAAFAPQAPVRDLAGLIAWNRAHAGREMRWFGQELFEQAEALGGLDSPAYREALATCVQQARDGEQGLASVLRTQRLDAIVAPTGGPAWLVDRVNGDHYSGSFSSPAAVAGCPHLTVPMGFVEGLPVGLSFVGAAFHDARVLALGHAYELASQARRAPRFLPTLPAAA